MTERSLTSIARPYAKAVFDYAVEEKDFERWSALLNQAASIIKDKAMQVFLKDLRFDKMVAYEALLSAVKSEIFRSGENFLKLIALHQRLLALPDIARLFEQYRAEQEKQATVEVVSAIPLTESERLALTKVLEERLQRVVKLSEAVDADILGGLVLRRGDLVMDSSVRGKLQRLCAALVN